MAQLKSITALYETYVANLGWEVDGDVEKAKACLMAALELSARRPTRVTIDMNVIEFDYVSIRNQIERMRHLIQSAKQASSSGDAVRVYDMGNLRD
jgi:hypothetical protein